MPRIKVHPDGPHLYVFGTEIPPYKIGYTKSLGQRQARLRCAPARNAVNEIGAGEFKLWRACPQGSRPRDFEGFIQSCYHPFRCVRTNQTRVDTGEEMTNWRANEWFDLPLSAISLTIDYAIERFTGKNRSDYWLGQDVLAMIFAQQVHGFAYMSEQF